MSLCLTATMICDGCGQVIGQGDFFITRRPTHHRIFPMPTRTSEERHFCNTKCQLAWHAQYPTSHTWGPAWEDRTHWLVRGGPQSDFRLDIHIIARTPN